MIQSASPFTRKPVSWATRRTLLSTGHDTLSGREGKVACNFRFRYVLCLPYEGLSVGGSLNRSAIAVCEQPSDNGLTAMACSGELVVDYGIMTYDFQDRFNIGDYVQSIAARQFLPRVDRYVCRESLHEYAGPDMKLILNGHFMRFPPNWPPSARIHPLFISFHINPKRAAGMLVEKGVEYLKKHGPIGCRDLSTLELLKGRGIEAYFSSCLTLTLGNRYRHQSDESIFFVDVLFRYPTWRSVFRSLNSFQKSLTSGKIALLGRRKRLLDRLFGRDIVQAAEHITHEYPAREFPTEDSRFELADRILKRYEKARLVVTSRIHCALPCVAMGTPVVFVNGGFQQAQSGRFTGNSRLFNTVEILPNGCIETDCDLDHIRKSMSAPVRTEHLEYVEGLAARCRQFAGDS